MSRWFKPIVAALLVVFTSATVSCLDCNVDGPYVILYCLSISLQYDDLLLTFSSASAHTIANCKQKEGLLRGFSPRESPTPNTRVVVESDNYKYRLHANRECRTPVGTKGSRDEVNLNKNESRNSCRRKCEALGDNCFGYSISTSGQCEVWNVKIGDYNDMVFSEGVDCLVREGSIGELPSGYTEYSEYSCRTKNGSRGTNGKEWDLFKKVSENSCRSRVSLNSLNVSDCLIVCV